MKRLLRAFGLGVIAGITLLQPASGNAEAADWHFQVLLDERPIGFHRFRVEQAAGQQVVRSEARFDVRVLFVPVYRYRHENTEVWQDGCLQSIRSQTDANGTPYMLDGRNDGALFVVDIESGVQRYADACMSTFAYWDRDFLQRAQLLNSQTGELIGVQVQPTDPEATFRVGERTVPAEGFRIRDAAGEVDIRVWYAQRDGRWLGLESTLPNGRLMRYVPAAAAQLASSATGEPQ